MLESFYMQKLTEFIKESVTPWHAAETVCRKLSNAGFQQLKENDRWKLEKGTGYFVTRNGSSVIAFRTGLDKDLPGAGFLAAAAHTDSPSLKVKTETLKVRDGIAAAGVEVYGVPVVSTWLDRELAMAGIVRTRGLKGRSLFYDSGCPVAVVPNAAVHLNRDVNSGFEYNKQTHLLAVFSGDYNKDNNPLFSMLGESLSIPAAEISGADLFLYDPFQGNVLGSNLYISPRLDNLAMCHAVLEAVTASGPSSSCQVAAFFDSEEIGSLTRQGAGGNFMSSVLERIVLSADDRSPEDCFRSAAASFLISADGTHASHPGFMDKYEPDYAPVLNGGPVIKYNGSGSYTSASGSAAIFEALCEDCGVKVQKFMNRSDMKSGGTVGPMLSSGLGIKSVDVGNAMLAMHSIRETCGTRDHGDMIKVLKRFYERGVS